jgi:hypothetical protein
MSPLRLTNGLHFATFGRSGYEKPQSGVDANFSSKSPSALCAMDLSLSHPDKTISLPALFRANLI